MSYKDEALLDKGYKTYPNQPKPGYNGWKNWETWNVALWISNDEGLYNTARELPEPQSYSAFIDTMREMAPSLDDGFPDNQADVPPIALQTPDGVAWNDSGLDRAALGEMLREMGE